MQTPGAGCGEVRIVREHPHTESDGAATQFAANPAHADYAKRLVVELHAFETLFIPTLGANVCIGLRNFARNTKQQGKCMLGSGNGVPARCVQHNNAAACGCLYIYIVHPHSGTADDAQFRTGIQNVRDDFGLAAHHQRAECRNDLDKFTLLQAGFNCDLQRIIARKLVHSVLRNGVSDEDLERSHSSFAVYVLIGDRMRAKVKT